MTDKRGAKFIWQALVVLFVLAGVISVEAQNIRLRSNRDPLTSTSRTKYADITADGNIAVMGSYSARGAWIYDVSDPDNPVLKSHYNPGNNQQFLEAIVVGNRAYFGSGNNGGSLGGVHIVDITNPSNPVLLGRVSLANGGYDTIHEMVVDGDYLYINSNSTATRPLKIINISNPAQPRLVNTLTPVNSGWVHAMFVKNGRMYTSGFGGTGLTEIYDVTNLENQAPRLLGQVATGTSTHSNWVSEDGNWLFVCREFVDGELRVYNISNPASPQLVKIVKAADLGINAVCPHNPVVKDNLLYVSWYQGGVQVFDITNPVEMKRVGQYDTYAPQYNEELARDTAESLGGEPWDLVCGALGLVNNVPSGFDGNWTAYPLLGHDKVIMSDLATGLYIVDASRVMAPAVNEVADFDGDGKTDYSRYTPATGLWSIERSSGGTTSTNFGAAGDVIAPADYDGDGKTDIAVTRNTNGSKFWFILNSNGNTFRAEQFGAENDKIVPGDFDSDGRFDLAVFRNGVWYIQQSTAGFRGIQWGTGTDEPLVGDFDGDGKTDIAVARAVGTVKDWYIMPSTWAVLQSHRFGNATDKTVIGDFDGDAKTDIAVYRPENGYWYIKNSKTNTISSIQFGIAEDLPIPADYDGDAKTDIAVFRPTGNNWYGLNSTNGAFFARQFGAEGDLPAPRAAQPR
ncbi:MAG TPA: FG-GAP-like repeat-containing protein [Pyrinomonadaceae bacterium]|nr:FG-GAP-like repeat-containing protein [Pyrinomonadaceae bacterium]